MALEPILGDSLEALRACPIGAGLDGCNRRSCLRPGLLDAEHAALPMVCSTCLPFGSRAITAKLLAPPASRGHSGRASEGRREVELCARLQRHHASVGERLASHLFPPVITR